MTQELRARYTFVSDPVEDNTAYQILYSQDHTETNSDVYFCIRFIQSRNTAPHQLLELTVGLPV